MPKTSPTPPTSPPKAAAGFNNWLEQTNSHYRIQLGAAALRDARYGTLQAMNDRIRSKIAAGDYPAARTVLHEAHASDLINDNELKAGQTHIETTAARRQKQDEIERDPAAYVDKISSDAPPEGRDSLVHYNDGDFAKDLLLNNTASTAGKIVDGIHDGNLDDLTDLQNLAKAGGLRPTAIAPLEDAFKNMGDPAYRALIRTPDYQHETAGQVERGIRDFNTTGPNFDADYTRLLTLVRTLPEDAAVRTTLQQKLDGLHSSAARLRDDNVEWGRQQLADAYAGLFGHRNEGMSIQAALDAGFLQNRENLRAHGFTDDQASQIIDAGNNHSQAAAHDARVAAFQHLDPLRDKTAATSDPYAALLFDGIRNGIPRSQLIPDPAVQRQVDLAYGKGLTEYERLNRIDGNVSRQDLMDRINAIVHPEAIQQASDKHFGPPRASY